ncbi:hypothetical protein R6Q57_026577 [Mikania cordata]
MGQQLENTKPVESQGASVASWWLDSPKIYLFGGIGLMLLLIAVALLVLACSQWRLGSYGDDGQQHVCHEADVSPKNIAVIMAGEHLPTYLAAPAHVPNRIQLSFRMPPSTL